MQRHSASHTNCLAPLLPWICSQQEIPKDPEEDARLQQLQAAAAQWQHVQQQRAAFQYQALMQQHEKLQQILEKYQQLIQQSTNVQVCRDLFILRLKIYFIFLNLNAHITHLKI